MHIRSIHFGLLVLAVALAGGCQTEADLPNMTDPLAERLTDMGFEAGDIVPSPDGVVAQTATHYTHADGRSALLISDELATGIYALIFSPTGELQDRVSADADVPYCGYCTLGYWSCYGSCAPACWADFGFGQGCHSDCSNSCDLWWWICEHENLYC